MADTRICECERGPIVAYVSVTKENGELLDRTGFCRQCLDERATKIALETLGLTVGEL